MLSTTGFGVAGGPPRSQQQPPPARDQTFASPATAPPPYYPPTGPLPQQPSQRQPYLRQDPRQRQGPLPSTQPQWPQPPPLRASAAGRPDARRDAGEVDDLGSTLSELSDEINGGAGSGVSTVLNAEIGGVGEGRSTVFNMVASGKTVPKGGMAGVPLPPGSTKTETQALVDFLKSAGPATAASPLAKVSVAKAAPSEEKKKKGFNWFRPNTSGNNGASKSSSLDRLKKSSKKPGPKSPPPPSPPPAQPALEQHRMHAGRGQAAGSASDLPSAADLASFDVSQDSSDPSLQFLRGEVQQQLQDLTISQPSKPSAALGALGMTPPHRPPDTSTPSSVSNAVSMQLFYSTNVSDSKVPLPNSLTQQSMYSAHPAGSGLVMPPPPPATNDEAVLRQYDQSLRLYQSFLRLQQQQQQQQQQFLQQLQKSNTVTYGFDYVDDDEDAYMDEADGMDDDDDTDLSSIDDELRANTLRNSIVTSRYPPADSDVVVPVEHHFHHHHHHHHYHHESSGTTMTTVSSSVEVRPRRRNSKTKRVIFRNSVEQLTPVSVILSSVSKAGGVPSDETVRRTAGGGAIMIPAEKLTALVDPDLVDDSEDEVDRAYSQITHAGISGIRPDDPRGWSSAGSDDTEPDDHEYGRMDPATSRARVPGGGGGGGNGLDSGDETEDEEEVMYAVSRADLKPEAEDREDLRPGDVIANGDISPVAIPQEELDPALRAAAEMQNRKAERERTFMYSWDGQDGAATAGAVGTTVAGPEAEQRASDMAADGYTVRAPATSADDSQPQSPSRQTALSPGSASSSSGTAFSPDSARAGSSGYFSSGSPAEAKPETAAPEPPASATPVAPPRTAVPPPLKPHMAAVEVDAAVQAAAEAKLEGGGHTAATVAVGTEDGPAAAMPPSPPTGRRRVRHVQQQTRRVATESIGVQAGASADERATAAATAAAEAAAQAALARLRGELARVRVEGDVARAVADGLRGDVARLAGAAEERTRSFDREARGVMESIRTLIAQRAALAQTAGELRDEVARVSDWHEQMLSRSEFADYLNY
ncbi:hypothetical protein HK405_007671 [Cladochytrium tenue]|nr:hypothetical protein HK405_007671 [Cladochytrium tenue]